MTDLEEALRAGAADWILRAVTRDLQARARSNGGAPSFPRCVDEALRCLQSIADGGPAMSVSGPPPSTVLDVLGMRLAAVAAREAGCTPRHASRLASSGKVRSHRLGPRALLIDVEGLARALRGSA